MRCLSLLKSSNIVIGLFVQTELCGSKVTALCFLQDAETETFLFLCHIFDNNKAMAMSYTYDFKTS